MDCTVTRQMLYRRLDGELSDSERVLLDMHLAQCPACTHEYRLLRIPQRLARAIPPFQPSPYFYGRLKARLVEEDQGLTLWQIILGLSRQVIPALAAITLVLLSLYAYLEIRPPSADVISAYDGIFTSGERIQRMFIADQNDITDENILLSISEQQSSDVRKK